MANRSKAVTKITTGGSRRASSTANPSISGICTSRKTRSGLSSWIAATAEPPSWHSATIVMSRSPGRSVRSRSHASGSSSTISTRMQRLRVRGNVQPGAESSSRCVAELELSRAAVQLREACACIRGPHAFADVRCPGPVVADFDHQGSPAFLHHHVDTAAAGVRPDAVPDSVLDQWLHDQVGHEQVERSRLDRPAYLETVAKTHLLDFQVFVEI